MCSALPTYISPHFREINFYKEFILIILWGVRSRLPSLFLSLVLSKGPVGNESNAELIGQISGHWLTHSSAPCLRSSYWAPAYLSLKTGCRDPPWAWAQVSRSNQLSRNPHSEVSSPSPRNNKVAHGFPFAVCVHSHLKSIKGECVAKATQDLGLRPVGSLPEKSPFPWMLKKAPWLRLC